MNQSNVTQLFKDQLDNLDLPKSLDQLRSIKADKTVNIHLDRIKLGKFERWEINAFTKLIASSRFASVERKFSIEQLQELTMKHAGNEYVYSDFQGHVMHFNKPAKISKEQTLEGKQWLLKHFFKTNGQPRNGKATEDVSDRVLRIAKSVSKFQFIGVLEVTNRFGDISQVLPIYRTFNRKGEYFDYAPIHWGQPIIMENY